MIGLFRYLQEYCTEGSLDIPKNEHVIMGINYKKEDIS